MFPGTCTSCITQTKTTTNLNKKMALVFWRSLSTSCKTTSLTFRTLSFSVTLRRSFSPILRHIAPTFQSVPRKTAILNPSPLLASTSASRLITSFRITTPRTASPCTRPSLSSSPFKKRKIHYKCRTSCSLCRRSKPKSAKGRTSLRVLTTRQKTSQKITSRQSSPSSLITYSTWIDSSTTSLRWAAS